MNTTKSNEGRQKSTIGFVATQEVQGKRQEIN